MTLAVYKWICPLCGESGVQIPDVAEPRAVVANSLQTHIRSSSDERHGPPGDSPDGIGLSGLETYVVPQKLGG